MKSIHIDDNSTINTNFYKIKTKNNALSFDGIDDFVVIPFNKLLKPTNITIELWAKSSTEYWNCFGALVSLRDAYIIHPEKHSKSIEFYIIDKDGYFVHIQFKPEIDITEWHHYAGTYDGEMLNFYIDGKLVTTGKNRTDKSTGKIGDLYIGADSELPERYFNGTIDEVRIWNYAKNQEKIQRQMYVKLNGNEKGLVAYYNFNQGIANDTNCNEQILYDLTGNNNGTLKNFSLSGDTSNWVSSSIVMTNNDSRNEIIYYIFSLRNLLIFISVLIIIFLILYIRARNQKKIRKYLEDEVNKKTKELVKENKIKDALIGEIHHRVKNNLQTISSLIYFQQKSLPNEENKSGLENIQTRVNSMAAIHEMLYSIDDMTMVSLRKFIADFVNYLDSMINNQEQKIEINYDIEEIEFNISQAITLGLMISEIITNSLKYAFKEIENPLINIKIYQQNNEILFSIKDNGCGVDEIILKNKEKSLGFKLIDIFAKQLNAKMDIFNNHGLEYKFSFITEK
ncbi:MAG: LamG-like jellyroll fold domain-containing protein [Bacteroidota bacterium]|nr:LamG-like jellyroll fold domain-containing protein [Bacteroidota bacterium]